MPLIFERRGSSLPAGGTACRALNGSTIQHALGYFEKYDAVSLNQLREETEAPLEKLFERYPVFLLTIEMNLPDSIDFAHCSGVPARLDMRDALPSRRPQFEFS